jgi:hypothetical protein
VFFECAFESREKFSAKDHALWRAERTWVCRESIADDNAAPLRGAIFRVGVLPGAQRAGLVSREIRRGGIGMRTSSF